MSTCLSLEILQKPAKNTCHVPPPHTYVYTYIYIYTHTVGPENDENTCQLIKLPVCQRVRLKVSARHLQPKCLQKLQGNAPLPTLLAGADGCAVPGDPAEANKTLSSLAQRKKQKTTKDTFGTDQGEIKRMSCRLDCYFSEGVEGKSMLRGTTSIVLHFSRVLQMDRIRPCGSPVVCSESWELMAHFQVHSSATGRAVG